MDVEKKERRALVLGHGPSNKVSVLKKISPSDYDFVVTCHDDCNIFQAWGPWQRKFYCLGVDDNEWDLAYSKNMTTLGIPWVHPIIPGDVDVMKKNLIKGNPCIHLWEAPIIFAVGTYSGISALFFAAEVGHCKVIHTLGLDWTYTPEMFMQLIQKAYMILWKKYDLKDLRALDDNSKPSGFLLHDWNDKK